jgi:protein-S-isoprenylcysteine O-methyltransferase Ste14
LPKAKKLVTTGIYSRLRHPIYAGQILVCAGWIISFNSWLVFGISAVVIAIAISRAIIEEKVLTKEFGKEYLAYKKRTWL